MDAIEQLQQDVHNGRIDAQHLIDLLAWQQRQLQAAYQRIAQLEQQLGGATTAKLEEPFSVRAEEQRQQARGRKQRQRKRKGRTGRRQAPRRTLTPIAGSLRRSRDYTARGPDTA